MRQKRGERDRKELKETEKSWKRQKRVEWDRKELNEIKSYLNVLCVSLSVRILEYIWFILVID